jgi:hypothetical protein
MDNFASNNNGNSNCCCDEEEMFLKKVLAVFVLAFLLSVMAGTQFVSLGEANPNWRPWEGPSPSDYATAPVISIFSPENNTVYSPDNVPLIFNVTVGESEIASSMWIDDVFYKGDWQQGQHYVYSYVYPNNYSYSFEFSANLSGIPEGNHRIVVHAGESGRLSPGYGFGISCGSVVDFVVDATPPSVSVLPMDKTYNTSDVPINFTVNESDSQVKYSLDGQENVTVAGNTTLTDLPNGEHTVSVYATDTAGNTGASETVSLTVHKEIDDFPTWLGPAIATIATVGAALIICLVKFKKQPKKSNNNRPSSMNNFAFTSGDNRK